MMNGSAKKRTPSRVLSGSSSYPNVIELPCASPDDTPRKMKEILANKRRNQERMKNVDDSFTYALLALVVIITIVTYPSTWETVSVVHVWYYGWLTAISTGLGVVPFFIFSEPDKYWMAISNGKPK